MTTTTTTGKPLLRGHFHQAMFFIFLGAVVPLLMRTKTTIEFVAILIYAVCALLMFGTSSLYHRIYWSPKNRALWKKADHAGIYLMIAGSFTPIALIGLEGPDGIKLLTIIWLVASVGIIQSFFFVHLPKYVSALIYVIAGYLIIPYVSELHGSMGFHNLVLLVLGGVSYTLGAIGYGLKRPRLNPKYFGYHEVFHLFVNLGAAFHFFAIASLIRG
jgi:hemolysin III